MDDDGIKPGQATETRPITPLTRKGHNVGMIILGVLLFFSVLIPYIFWKGTWFGRRLTDAQMQAYLQDEARPRHIQHALSQIADRIIAGETAVTEWYPQVQTLATHKLPKIRYTAAWVMGQDNGAVEFHAMLRQMLEDPAPLVRRNAALSLVRFDDRTGKAQILAMLEPFEFRSPRSGTITLRLTPGDSVNPDTLLARLKIGENDEDAEFEVRSPLPGTLDAWLVEDGTSVFEGQPLVSLTPSDKEAREALRALYLIGESEDLSLINRIAGGAYGLSVDTRQQAILTAQAIQQRKTER